MGEPIPSEDTVLVIAKNDQEFYPQIATSSDLVLRMHFPKREDILTIFAICFGIQSTKATESYTLVRYNSYFFCWMIVTGIARSCVRWETLVDGPVWKQLIASIAQDPYPEHLESGLSNQPKFLIFKASNLSKAPHSVPSSPFIDSALLCNHLRIKLLEEGTNVQEEIRIWLQNQLFSSRFEPAMQRLFKISAPEVARSAALSNSTQVAYYAVVETMIEAIWRDSSDVLGEAFWQEKCRVAKECVQNASEAAGELVGKLGINSNTSSKHGTSRTGKYSTQWETAWDKSWHQCCATNDTSTTSLIIPKDGEGTDVLQNKACTRAKSAWIKAWDDASRITEECGTLLGSRVAEYMDENLPETLPEVLEYSTETNTVPQVVVEGLTSTTFKGSSNSKLQGWIRARIVEHCQRVHRLTAGAQKPSKQEFEQTMREVWERTVSCFAGKSEAKVLAGSKIDPKA
ncbi:unnamed protein product [Rhizoctonia solani]|nr:unnamed protein product [Rhizoctonia solani]